MVSNQLIELEELDGGGGAVLKSHTENAFSESKKKIRTFTVEILCHCKTIMLLAARIQISSVQKFVSRSKQIRSGTINIVEISKTTFFVC